MKLTAPRDALDQWHEMREAFSPAHQAISKDLPFGLDLLQYDDDSQYDRDLHRVKPRSQSIFRLWRFKLGVTLKRAPIHLNCEPVDEVDDPTAAEWLKRALEWELFGDRQKNFKHARTVYVGGALAGRCWSARWDFDPNRGKYGGINCVPVDPRNITFTPGFLTPHDNECPLFAEMFRMPVRAAQGKRGWKNTRKLKPDDGPGAFGDGRSNDVDLAGNVRLGGTAGEDGVDDQNNVGGFFTGVKLWFRHETVNETLAFREFGPEQRYMKCLSCGEQSPSQAELQVEDLPELAERACPLCSGDMERQDADIRERENKRCLILAPFQDGLELYDGAWPYKCSTFPYLWLTPYIFPHKPIPQSDVSLNRTVALGQNLVLRETYEQTMLSRPRYLLPRDGLENASGTRFDLSGPDAAMFYTTDFPPDGVNVIQSLPVNRALFELHSMLKGEFRENEGTPDMSLGPERSRDIAASSLELQIESGNVPVDLFIDHLYDAESTFLTTLGEIVIDTYSPQKIRYYDPEANVLAWRLLYGSEMPMCDVTVSAGPSLDNVKEENIKAFMTLTQGIPPQYRRAFARFAKLDRSIIDEIEKADQQAAMQQQQQMAQAAAMGMAMPGAPEREPAMAGANGRPK